uniref:DUF4808 domain-containing protein n=1 Tax=Heterorhabditis bacteriophora TaxID=37862 RepID=A0A1I7XLR7_HETBA
MIDDSLLVSDYRMPEVGTNHGSKASVTNTMAEDRTLEYVNRPEGEMEMMVGFFVMNGVCVVFFLLFGLCVIFSCLRRRPKLFRAPVREVESTNKAQPMFKSLVSRAMKNDEFKNLKSHTEDIESLTAKDTKVDHDGEQVQIHVMGEPCNGVGGCSHHGLVKPTGTETEVSAETQPKSIIRQNLLGPLSFDDLYYT